MKLSLAWLSDHIKGGISVHDIDSLAQKLTTTVAEIDDMRMISCPADQLMLARVVSFDKDGIVLEGGEIKKKITLPLRAYVSVGQIYLLKKEGKGYCWASLLDLGSEKDGVVPELFCSESDLKGGWKKKWEDKDYIITVENKALTHRPDMWGHRGVAREIAALLRKSLLSEELLLATQSIKHYGNFAPASDRNPFSMSLENEGGGKRLAGLYIPQIKSMPSLLWYAHRLARVDCRPMSMIVDLANYVMFDMGQPLHTFDAQQIPSRAIKGRFAQDGEQIELLDGKLLILTGQDYVIADDEKPLSLAGIMGGKATAVTDSTTEIFVESGNFDASMIRRSAARHKLRTEASTRFEKTLDPNQNTVALERFIKLLNDADVQYRAADTIFSLGALAQEKIITISHEKLVQKLGTTIAPDAVEELLSQIGFGVRAHHEADQVIYSITVPTMRGSKDILMAEDIIEEVGRLVGFSVISYQLPTRTMAPFDMQQVIRRREIKKYCAYGAGMHELASYALYDEDFLKQINYEPTHTICVNNSVSTRWQRLATSLIPHLLKAVLNNKTRHETIRFFEIACTWAERVVTERTMLAGILVEQKKPFDFYEGKSVVMGLCDLLGLELVWRPAQGEIEPWYDKFQTADLVSGGRIVGRAGMAAPLFMKDIATGFSFIFEIDATFLITVPDYKVMYSAPSRFQDVELDMSLLVDRACTVDQLTKVLLSVDKRIKQVTLRDFYEKKEWADKKSVTFRCVLVDDTKTLAKEDIEQIEKNMVKAVQEQGAQVR